jgi:hypothetical protein
MGNSAWEGDHKIVLGTYYVLKNVTIISTIIVIFFYYKQLFVTYMAYFKAVTMYKYQLKVIKDLI